MVRNHRRNAMPLRPQDLTLLAVVFASMAMGISYPGPFTFLQPYPLVFLMILFFMSFLSISSADVGRAFSKAKVSIIAVIVLKMVILPPCIYVLFLIIMPSYALSALLLTAVSTGVVAPFISNLVGGNSALVLIVTVFSSLLVPFSLPAVIEMVLSKRVELSFWEMIHMLSLAVFVPIVAVEALRRLAPHFLTPIKRHSFAINVVMFALIILAIFSRYADVFHHDPLLIIEALTFALMLAAMYSFLGIMLFRNSTTEDRLAGAVMFTHMNNVLILVFSARFFGPREVITAALYIVPFFVLILPLRRFGSTHKVDLPQIHPTENGGIIKHTIQGLDHEKKRPGGTGTPISSLVAGGGFEPPTFGL